MQPHLSRRGVIRSFFGAAAAAAYLVPGRTALAAADADLVGGLDVSIVREGRKAGPTWFHPRGCYVPGNQTGDQPSIVMTMQTISGSDQFGPVHWWETRDLGKTWTEPRPIPNMERHPFEGGLEEGVCDVVPEYHAKTRSILAIGHNVFYKKGALHRPQPPRHPMYSVRDPAGNWTAARKLVWDDPRGSLIYTCGCGQRAILDNGDVLIPISFAPAGRTDRMVATLRCSFDGKDLVAREVGNELQNKAGRGLLEPSMTTLDGRFYLTLRAEDGHGHVATSDDGMKWSNPAAWSWDDGSAISMSTTQQHWLTHAEQLYLVYTRKAEANVNTMRWRSPLYMAAVDRKTLRLIKATERIVFPMQGDGVNDAKKVAGMGNFHTNAVSANESWITVGEEFPGNGWRGDLLLARVRWGRPNRLA